MSAVLRQFMSDSPVLLWMLDETTGTTFKDVAGTNNANVSGGATLSVGTLLGAVRGAGFVAASTQSANRDSSVGTVSAVLPEGSAACTMEALAYPTGAGSYAALCYGKTNAGGEHRNFQVGSNAAASAFSDGVNGSNNKAWTTAIPQNMGTLCAMTYAGGAGGAAIFYQNGVADTTTTLTLNTAAGTDRVRGGLRSDDSRATAYFQGRLALCAIYSTALTATRLLAHYQAVISSGEAY